MILYDFAMISKAPMKIKIDHFQATVLGIMLVVASMTTLAAPANITEAELKLLPPYCPHTMAFKGYNAVNRAKWEPLMGGWENFSAMHHYCWALISFRRAERSNMTSQEKRGLRTVALGDFGYVVKNTSSDFILLPEILTWIGRTEILLGNPAGANAAFARARTIKPDYWPAYTHWADFLQAKGQKKEAMEIVKSGLQHAPEAKALHTLFRTLGGKIADIPPPILKKESTPSEETSTGPAIDAAEQKL
jgi:hypothetical protein